MARIWIVIAAILGALGVAAGAFGSHALQPFLSAKALTLFEVANRYQFIHTLALGWVGILSYQFKSSTLFAAGTAFVIGILLFSGSLYALSLTGIEILGAITPVGGVALIIGWICVAVAALRFDDGA